MTKQGAPPSEQNGEKGCFLLREASETPTTKNRVFPQTRQRETCWWLIRGVRYTALQNDQDFRAQHKHFHADTIILLCCNSM